MQNQKIIIAFGAPGAGKGFFSEKLVKTNRFIHYSPGNIIRNILQEPHVSKHRLLLNCINEGKLAPASMVKQLMLEKISEQNDKIIILDGYPRNEIQRIDLQDICKTLRARVIAIVYLKIDFTKAQERLHNRIICQKCSANFNLLTDPPKLKMKCDYCKNTLVRRKDDAKIKVRFQIFKSETMPIIIKYAKNLNFYEIDSLAIEKSLSKIVKKLYLLK